MATATPPHAADVTDPDGQKQAVPWPRYECHKIVAAAVITEIVHDVGAGLVILVRPHGDGPTEPFRPSEAAMTGRATIGGYAVIYEDGFCSVSPKDVFEAGYTPVRAKGTDA